MNKDNDNRGWIRMYRKSVDDPMYFEEKFTRWQAWCDLLFLAAHKPNRFRIRGNKVELGVGQLAHGIRELSARWKWSAKKVQNVLKEFEEDNKISIDRHTVINIITIINYEKYQQSDTQNDTQSDTQSDTNQELKEINNYKNNITPTCAHARTREEQYEAVIAVFVDFKSSIGQVYVPHWPTQTTDATQLGDQLRQAYGEQWEDSDWRGLLDKAWRTADNFERKNFTLHYICTHFDSFLNRPDMQTAAEEQPKEVCGFRMPTEKERAMAILNS